LSKDFDQLAAVLKSCGIVASHYDAKMMAESINDGVRQNSAYYQEAYTRIMGTGKREESRAPLPDSDSSIVSHIHRDPAIENVPLEPEKEAITNISTSDEEMCIINPLDGEPIAQPEEQAGEPAQAVICDEVAEAQDIAESILREKEVESPSEGAVESPEPKVDIEIMSTRSEAPANISPEPIAAAPSPAQPSSSEDMQLMVKKMAEQMMQQAMAQQAAQQQALQEQLRSQQQLIQQMNAQQAAMKEAMQKPAPQPAQAVVQEKPKQVFAYPAKEASKGSGYFREIPVDRSRPKPTLTKEEEKATDITHWFNFSKR